LPLHNGEVCPAQGELFEQGRLVVAAEIVAFSKTRVKRGQRAIPVLEVIRNYGLELMQEFEVEADTKS